MLEVVQARLAKKEKKLKKSVVCRTVCQVSLHSAALVLSGISSNTVGLAHSSLFLMPFNLCLLSEVEDSSLSLSSSILHLYTFFFTFSFAVLLLLLYCVTPNMQNNQNCTALTKEKLQFYYYNPKVCDSVMGVIALNPV